MSAGHLFFRKAIGGPLYYFILRFYTSLRHAALCVLYDAEGRLNIVVTRCLQVASNGH